MFSKKKLANLFTQPEDNAWQIIEDQLERMEKQFTNLLDADDKMSALAIYQEYQEWIDSPEGEKCDYLYMEKLS